MESRIREVGPVLNLGVETSGFVAAIKRLNSDVRLTTRASYVRVGVPQRCILMCASLEQELGRHVEWPAALEQIMPSFKGRMQIFHDHAEWVDDDEQPGGSS